MKKIIPIVIVVFIVIFFISLFSGSVKITFSDLMTLFQKDVDNDFVKTIVMDVRLPRIIMALLTGMMLASSGTVVQTVFQNPLADPYIIGISASATFGAVLSFVLNLPDYMYGIMAFFTSVITSFMIFKISRTSKKTHTSTLLIVGVAVSSFLGAFTSFTMYLIGEDSFKIIMWTMGYLGGASWSKIVMMIFPLILSIILFILNRNELDALLSGEEEAHALGVNVEKLKKTMLITASLIVAFSVAFTGMIGFVGLIVPHIMRMFVGSSNSKLIPLATVFGGIFLLASDTIARTILAPVEIPIGVITSFFGAPFFLYLALKGKRGGFH
ncbi:iron ABC transporter permease [Oceanotoga sp. DSM 15011]|jgi:iron complex transport system permease protein|uniref:Iron complex transport system permease protein n=1 Tax=Oceanotoga teriensis TaxID=515440 RepID=A0AA45C6N0_9BACT|nr:MULTISPECIES: iron ABC transporter permease [Oceanotoga]MDN5341990.1 cobalamin transport system permease protein [Oceanotoga sp.]MDO7976051.1 iron ABC transporter permease [Oceanotoga teriensis]PWJ92096.1 iron complex transport system permease protein [Oceanotoga teriensis]UYO98954.1 iron ABC transporter permease [Oceanotoga sp. DSM 15011]